MGQIIIELPSRIVRRYRVADKELADNLLDEIEKRAVRVKQNSALSKEDIADIHAARRARKEKDFITLEELKAELGL